MPAQKTKKWSKSIEFHVLNVEGENSSIMQINIKEHSAKMKEIFTLCGLFMFNDDNPAVKIRSGDCLRNTYETGFCFCGGQRWGAQRSSYGDRAFRFGHQQRFMTLDCICDFGHYFFGERFFPS